MHTVISQFALPGCVWFANGDDIAELKRAGAVLARKYLEEAAPEIPPRWSSPSSARLAACPCAATSTWWTWMVPEHDLAGRGSHFSVDAFRAASYGIFFDAAVA